MLWGSRTPSSARRQHRNAAMVLRGDSPGVLERGRAHKVHPGTWEPPCSPSKEAGRATGEERPWPAGVRRPTPCGSERKDVTTVPLSEGNEVRREGAWGVGVLSKYRGSGGTD